MNQLNTKKVALATGMFLGGWHLIWSIIVMIGLGQKIYDFVLWAHMIHMPITIGPFDLTASISLIVLTFILGYIFGWAFAYIWNILHK